MTQAEVQTRGAEFCVEGRQWREAAFTGADDGGARLKQRQQEMRRQLLRPTAAEPSSGQPPQVQPDADPRAAR